MTPKYVRITSRFHGRCRQCGVALVVGSTVAYQPGVKGVLCTHHVPDQDFKDPLPSPPTRKIKVKTVRPDDAVTMDIEVEPDPPPPPPPPQSPPSPPPNFKTVSWPSNHTHGKNYALTVQEATPSLRETAVHCSCMSFAIRKACVHVNEFNSGMRRIPFNAAPHGPAPPPGTTARRASINQRIHDLAARLKIGSVDLSNLSDDEALDLLLRMGRQTYSSSVVCYYCNTRAVDRNGLCHSCQKTPEPPPTRFAGGGLWTCATCSGKSDLHYITCSGCGAHRGNIPSDVVKALHSQRASSQAGATSPSTKTPPSWLKAMEAFQEVVVDAAMQKNAPPALKPAFEKYAKLASRALHPATPPAEGKVALRLAMIELIKICFDHIV